MRIPKQQCPEELSMWEPAGHGPVNYRCILTDGHARFEVNPIGAHLTKNDDGQLILWGAGLEHGIQI